MRPGLTPGLQISRKDCSGEPMLSAAGEEEQEKYPVELEFRDVEVERLGSVGEEDLESRAEVWFGSQTYQANDARALSRSTLNMNNR